MSSVAVHAGLSPFFSAGSPDRQSELLKQITRSERLTPVLPASRLEVRPRPEMLPTGIPELDALTGGLPRGCLTEICGTTASGKSSVLLATIASATRREESCVLIDASDSFDPASGAAAGAAFARLLWVRCGWLKNRPSAISRQSSVVGRRSSARDLPPPLEMFSGLTGSPQSGNREPGAESHDARRTTRDEFRLEQVLKTTDLILQSGGFGLVAVDLAGIPEKFVRRIPLASWFRFQRAVEHTTTALLVISEIPCAQTCAALALRIGNQLSAISHQPSGPAHAVILETLHVQAELVRSRLERKPMHSVKATFKTRMP